MAFQNVLNRITGGGGVASSISATLDDAFADFATAAAPLAPSHASPTGAFDPRQPVPTGIPSTGFFGEPYHPSARPFTKWYRIWERVTYHDFMQELIIIPLLLITVLINYVGSQMNKSRVRTWAATYLPLLEAEFASVGFPASPGSGAMRVQGLSTAIEEATKKGGDVPETLLRQKKKNEFYTYATGRQNVAWLDVQLTLYKRYNPFIWALETALAFVIDSIPAPEEKMEATAYVFDGKEKSLAPNATGGGGNSGYNGFVFAIVHKDRMRALRDERYDLSLTATRDNAKLPDWATVMSESAEITDALVTPELVKAVEAVGEALEALILTDLPVDAPKKLNDLIPKKRITLLLRSPFSLSSTTQNTSNALQIFTHVLRLPDTLTSIAHFRPEALRKIKQTREDAASKIRKLDEEEKAEERKVAGDKARKEERERKLNGMGAEEQKKFLSKEKEREQGKGLKKRSMRA